MANGPLGGFMPTPAAPAQPPQVKLDTTANSRGNFNNFLKNINGALSVNPPVTAPVMGAMTPNMAPAANIDIFNQPMTMMEQGGNVPPRNTNIMGQPHMLAYITPQEGQLLENLGGANQPGPMGIPSFFDTGDDIGNDMGNVEGGDPGDPGVGDNTDTSAPDSDMDYTDSGSGDSGTDFTGGVNVDVEQEEEEDSARGGDFLTGDDGIFTGYGAGYGKTIEDQIDQNPQLQGFLGNRIRDLVDKGKVSQFEYDKDGQLTGVYSRTTVPGMLGGIMTMLTGSPVFQAYTGYGKGSTSGLGGDDNVDDDLLKKTTPKKPEPEVDPPPNIIGGTSGQIGNMMPLNQPPIVASPFSSSQGTGFNPVTFDTGQLNKFIETLIGVPAKPVTAKQEGGLVAAVDEFLASGQ